MALQPASTFTDPQDEIEVPWERPTIHELEDIERSAAHSNEDIDTYNNNYAYEEESS